ncbi:PREDICTED: docking protein 2 isoform X3 [Chinchilla lanigera]|uniref:docking protein 2 isoform X3 n=1 Tax=Chinchilla lanigera TaxID=34839 RepID=UPI000698C061|nr:PREDICTED: docking protein 2 isoform X3 [Chinchilla lanigera]
MKLALKKKKNTARNHRAYLPVVIKQTRIVQKTLGGEEMNLREGGTQAEKREERRRAGASAGAGEPQQELGRPGGDGQNGGDGCEAGFSASPAAADFWQGVPCKEFAVTMRPTEASERCRLRGAYTLRTGVSALELWGGPEPGTQLYDWPYRFLRRFGRDKVTFSFEAGRRCVSGEGNFEFETRQGNEIFLALEEAIAAQKNGAPSGPPLAPATSPAVPTELPRPESPYSQPHDSLPPQPLASARAQPGSRPPEGEYAVPFDAVARSLSKSLPGILAGPSPLLADPLYDSIEEPAAPAPDHIYDEPEGVATLSLYDTPQESRGQAWRRKATAHGGPSDPQKDFSVLGWPQGTEYDNVVLKKSSK